MLVTEYQQACEQLWTNWRSGRCVVSSSVANRFQLDYAPEPYLKFGKGTDPLCILTTNPGAGMECQHRDNIVRGEPPIGPDRSYDDTAVALGKYYEERLTGAAKARLGAMRSLQDLVHKDCMLQFETIPLHSAKLPGKRKLPAIVDRCDVLADYSRRLSATLATTSVVALSAVSTVAPISRSSVAESSWLAWQAKLMGLDVSQLEFKRLLERDGKTTCGFAFQRFNNRTSGIVLMMGGNHFPAKQGLIQIANCIGDLRTTV